MSSIDCQYKISVMIITFNRKIELLRALESCVRDGFSDMEIVIVDNHSTDGTQACVENYLRECKVSYKYHYSEENLGVSEGRNLAFSLCEGEIIFCLDDDAMIISKNFFENLYKKMEYDNAVAASVEIYEPQNERFLKGYVYNTDGKHYTLSYIGAAHALRRDFFWGKPLYPSTMRFGSEEYYIACRLRKNGLRIHYYDDLKIHHLPSAVARVIGKDRILNIIVNTHLIRWMCYPKAILPILAITFSIRLISHGFLNKKWLHDIRMMINQRYDRRFVDRMSMQNWIEMMHDTRLTQLL